MEKHLLLEKAHVYPVPKQKPNLEGFSYGNEDGYWVSKASKEPFILDKNVNKPRTKKHDIETGEDQKGE